MDGAEHSCPLVTGRLLKAYSAFQLYTHTPVSIHDTILPAAISTPNTSSRHQRLDVLPPFVNAGKGRSCARPYDCTVRGNGVRDRLCCTQARPRTHPNNRLTLRHSVRNRAHGHSSFFDAVGYAFGCPLLAYLVGTLAVHFGKWWGG